MRRVGRDRDRAGAHCLQGPRHGVGRVWWRAGASLGALALILGACSGVEPAEPAEPTEPEDPNGETDADPEPSPEPTADETASGPPEVEPPEVPDIHREDDQGAQNAAEYFIELVTYAQKSGDLEGIEQMAHSECGSCDQMIEGIRSMHGDGEYRVGDGTDIRSVELYPPDEEDPAHLVRIYATEAPSFVVDQSGSEIQEFRGGDVVIDLLLSHPGGDAHWVVEGVSGHDSDGELDD